MIDVIEQIRQEEQERAQAEEIMRSMVQAEDLTKYEDTLARITTQFKEGNYKTLGDFVAAFTQIVDFSGQVCVKIFARKILTDSRGNQNFDRSYEVLGKKYVEEGCVYEHEKPKEVLTDGLSNIESFLQERFVVEGVDSSDPLGFRVKSIL